jgi:hypothetical protein
MGNAYTIISDKSEADAIKIQEYRQGIHLYRGIDQTDTRLHDCVLKQLELEDLRQRKWFDRQIQGSQYFTKKTFPKSKMYFDLFQSDLLLVEQITYKIGWYYKNVTLF